MRHASVSSLLPALASCSSVGGGERGAPSDLKPLTALTDPPNNTPGTTPLPLPPPPGKSVLLNHIISELRERYGEDDFRASVAVTAATGIAATHISGVTLHSALGCGAPQTTDDFGRMWKKESRQRLRALRVLILDEISMVSAEMFEVHFFHFEGAYTHLFSCCRCA